MKHSMTPIWYVIKIYLIALILLFAFPSFGKVPPIVPPEAQQILRQTMAENGYLTVEMHAEFWQILRSFRNDEAVLTGMSFLRSNLSISEAIQAATWKSMLLSWESNEPIKTEALKIITDELDKFLLENNPFSKGTNNHREFARSFEASYRQSIKSVEAFILAASKRQSFVNTENGRFHLSKSMIERVLTNMEDSFDRADRLLDPQWREN